MRCDHSLNIGTAPLSLSIRQPVGIRVNDLDGLELVFANDKDVDHTIFGKVEPSKA
ncbi:uncharacterized protein CC84DRAFT_1166602 [Paraphaeosphaeria sporulosa]|uniref:Uncharacterized protein n=1 Tax=Paraphaeosphaeria sporulosa TaxID=1460663 RepID=A0A177C7G3_9PLEO|nr:uncharacterized protein CC84DRAFT_1166602 [Paraphaeosphaeria sporulosa]OAG02792.1 hypothetical protein CC84DRAFT_1166602 [Paraphaeosphaeria sporulosa]